MRGLPAMLARDLGRSALVAALIAGPAACAADEAGEAAQDARPDASSALLAMLPDGREKRAFILDCTGCHTMSRERVFPGGSARSRDEWRDIVARMVAMAGAATSFPVISHERDPDATADWLAVHWSAPPARIATAGEPAAGAGAQRAADGRAFDVVEFMFPHPNDLPHDLAIERDGRVVVTGMFTHAMQRLDPATGAWEAFPIPVQHANPRALEIDDRGNWWVLLGAAQRIARYEPGSGAWTSWEVPFYGHSIRVAGDGRVWVNGHFTNSPAVLVALDPATDRVTRYEVPTAPDAGAGAGPIPYGLRAGPDGAVWGTELYGDRIFRLDPATRAVRAWPLPTPLSGARRPAFDAAGRFWVPEYAANRIARLDPESGEMREWPLPVADALPYVVVVDDARDRMWIGTGGADMVLAFAPRAEAWTMVGLPSAGALVRHMDVDRRNGDLWVAYGASPGIAARIARIRQRPRE